VVVAAEHHLSPKTPPLHHHSPSVAAQSYPQQHQHHDEQFANTNSNLYMWESVAADDEIEFENDLIASTNERLFDRKQMMLDRHLDSDIHYFGEEGLELMNRPPQNMAPSTVRFLASLY
jgi:hypothetical protein